MPIFTLRKSEECGIMRHCSEVHKLTGKFTEAVKLFQLNRELNIFPQETYLAKGELGRALQQTRKRIDHFGMQIAAL